MSERLEEIKHDYRNTEFASRFFTSFKNIDWLIEQAERVSYLEQTIFELMQKLKINDEELARINNHKNMERDTNAQVTMHRL